MSRLNRSILMLGSIGILLAGCAANPATGGYDQYGNPIGAYGTDPYGSSYSAMGDTSYDSSYDSSYSGGTDSYGSDPYSSGSTSGSYDDYGSTGSSTYPGASPSPSPSASPSGEPAAPSLDDRPVLSATLLEVKESGVFGMGKITAKVEIENPGNITLSGKLRVLFTDNGDPTPNAIVRKVTLHPKEKQTLTFTAKAWRLDDAEVSIETDEQTASKSGAIN